MGRPKKETTTTQVADAPKKVGIRPLMGYVLIEPAEAEIKTASGLYLPEGSQEKPAQGTVIAVGDGILMPDGKMFTAPVRIGEKVVYKKWGGDEIKLQGVEYKLVKFEDIMAILE